MKFRLKAGTHQDAAGTHRWNDPNTNVVESDDDLAAADPAKYERLSDGPRRHHEDDDDDEGHRGAPPVQPKPAEQAAPRPAEGGSKPSAGPHAATDKDLSKQPPAQSTSSKK